MIPENCFAKEREDKDNGSKVSGRWEPDAGVVLSKDLFAYGMKEGGKWRLLDYFNARAKAASAAKRAKANWLQAFGEEKEFSVFSFNPNTSAWEKQG